MNAPYPVRRTGPDAARDPPFAPKRRRRAPLGQILVEHGLITPDQKLEALEQQSRQDAPFGELLVRLGLLSQAQIDAALARHHGTEVADLRAIPPDITLIERLGVDHALETGQLPWQRRHDHVLVASARPDSFERHRTVLESLFGPVRMVITSQAELHRAVIDRHPLSLAAKAETRVPVNAEVKFPRSAEVIFPTFGIW
jgi:hypothetical protein